MDVVLALEALFFATDKPLTLQDLEIIFSHPDLASYNITKQSIETGLELLEKKHKETDSPIQLRQVNKGYQFFTKEAYYDVVRVGSMHKEKKKLSKSAIEALAIIAYKQPVTKAEIESIRGVNSDYAVQRLLELQLIEIAGRSDMPGKPLLYRTSDAFFQYFKINHLSDLPKFNEVYETQEEPAAETFQNPIKAQPNELSPN